MLNETAYDAVRNRGKWLNKYDFNPLVKVAAKDLGLHSQTGRAEIGLDLGLKTFVTGSNEKKYNTGRWYRKFEERLAKAQQDKKKKLAKTITAKIKNKRNDDLHKLSHQLVSENKIVVIGDVGGQKLCKTNMAKSVLDAGWSSFRTMLEYKAIRRHGVFAVVKEHNTTRTCSSYRTIPDCAPKG